MRICFRYDYEDLLGELEGITRAISNLGSLAISFRDTKELLSADIDLLKRISTVGEVDIAIIEIERGDIPMIVNEIDNIADFLVNIGAGVLMVKYKEGIEKGILDRIAEVFRDYDVKLSWILINKGSIRSMLEVVRRLCNEYNGVYYCSISTDEVYDEEVLLDILFEYIGYIDVICASNIDRNTKRGGLSIFDERGILNFRELIKILQELGYDGYFVLDYSRDNRAKYLDDARSIMEYVTSPSISEDLGDIFPIA